jgi:hypothetical protein
MKDETMKVEDFINTMKLMGEYAEDILLKSKTMNNIGESLREIELDRELTEQEETIIEVITNKIIHYQTELNKIKEE